jgi:hypothetical protein
MSIATNHGSWAQKIISRAMRNSLSPSHKLVQLGLSCMTYSIAAFAVLQTWDHRRTERLLGRLSSLSIANSTSNCMGAEDGISTNNVQLQLISIMSSQIALLSANLNSSLPQGRDGELRQLFVNRALGLDNTASVWPSIFTAFAIGLGMVGAAIFARGLKGFSILNATKVLTWGLGAGSLGLCLVFFWRDVDMGFLYVVYTFMPAQMSMYFALAYLVEHEEKGDFRTLKGKDEEDKI